MDTRSATTFGECFTELLADACRRLGKQKKELAYLAGVRPDYFSKLQSGERRPRGLEVLLRIATALRLDAPAIDRLLEAAGFPPLLVTHERSPQETTQVLALMRHNEEHAPLTELLIEAARLAEEQIRVRLARLGITYLEAGILVRLFRAEDGSLTMEDLTRSLNASRALVGFAVGQLQGRGLVTRTGADDVDRGVDSASLFSPSPDRSDDHVTIRLTVHGELLQRPITVALDSVESVLARSLTNRSSNDLRRLVNGLLRLRW